MLNAYTMIVCKYSPSLNIQKKLHDRKYCVIACRARHHTYKYTYAYMYTYMYIVHVHVLTTSVSSACCRAADHWHPTL